MDIGNGITKNYLPENYTIRIWSESTKEVEDASLRDVFDKEKTIDEMIHSVGLNDPSLEEKDNEGFFIQLTEIPTDRKVKAGCSGVQIRSIREWHHVDVGQQLLTMVFHRLTGEDIMNSGH